MNDLAPGIGHNLGFIGLDAEGKVTLAPEAMREFIAEDIHSLLARRDELLGSAWRAPATVTDDDVAGKTADLVKMIAVCIKNAEADRVARKDPFLRGGQVVDAVFRGVTEPLTKAKAEIERRLTLYQREKADAERRRREEIARQEREEAERRARAAAEAEAKAQTEADLDRAIAAEALAKQQQADAIEAQRAAEAKPADLSRSRSDMGAVASLHRFYDFTDLDREAIDLETLRPFIPLDAIEKAVRAFIKAGGRELRGVKIFENTETRVR